ncbi:DUF7527 domain-containing protein [Halalkalicoccus ordinarius]|uniref:DUF7527 domain-containing protein n=1 Tax=Halalkalicoccus ordinarius TaxID=3116651 RepID=UPI00300E8DAE
MRAETEARIERWETRPTDGGYAGLHALIEAGFSGVISADGTRLFVLDGRPIGLFGGPMESFENAPITAHVTPHPALPILFAMQERGGETTARCYTDDTPLADAAETLASNGFTGYVELSENVLSGEYYVVYHRGRSIPVAFVGEGDRLLVDDDARTRANEEVGIYEVTAVTLEELDLPEPPGDEPATARPSPTTSGRTLRDDGSIADADGPVDATDHAHTEAAGSAAAGPAGSSPAVDPDGADGPPVANGDPGGPDDSTDLETDDFRDVDTVEDGVDRTVAVDRWGSVVNEPVEDRIAAERRWREAVRTAAPGPERVRDENTVVGPVTETEPGTPSVADDLDEEASREPANELEVERRLREAAEAEADRLQKEVLSLRERLETFETADEAESSPAGVESAEELPSESIAPTRALSGTDLFVRYATASGPTLGDAHSDGVDRAAVDGNLRLERHTGFDPTGVRVGDRPFETFLEERVEHRFADWLIRSLSFDVRETGHRKGLERLYDAIPEIDRIDFGGIVDVGEDVGTGEGENPSFDVVFRNRMGEALIVADCVDSREAVGEEQVASLVTAATAAREAGETLAGAMLVTTSFFGPDALETAVEATRSGLLGRNARESYVTISRRSGYHLCLIEMRDAFHVRVPEL